MQWGFCGPAYEAANPAQDSQRLINWFVEIDGNENNPLQPGVIAAEAKVAIGLLGVPGLQALNTAYTGEFRGGWVLPGNVQCLLVIGNVLILATIQTPATANAFAVLSFATIGTLNTLNGQVKIRDNGAGAIAVIVDGPYLYVYNVKTQKMTVSTDAAFLGSNTVAEIDGWFIFQKPNTQLFYTSPIYWNGITAFDGTYFALKDDCPDNLVAIIENGRQLWLIGESTTEPWYNAGGAFFPFARLEGGLMQIGCAAAQTVARTGPSLIWLARSERGENSVVMTQGYQYKAISNPALSYALTQYPVISDAIGYVYAEEGHEFYVLIFPTADVTWVYDLTTNIWHQRASFDPVMGQMHRQRLNNLVNFAGMRIGGDFSNGRIYLQSRKFYADDQYPLVALRRAPHVWDKDSRNRVVHARLQLDFFPGSGLATGQGIDPQVMLRWSDDGGQSWGNQHWTGIGKIGATKNRAIWRRLGSSRDRVYEASISDPVKRDIAGASIEVMGTKA
jgi:hypothetical protein